MYTIFYSLSMVTPCFCKPNRNLGPFDVLRTVMYSYLLLVVITHETGPKLETFGRLADNSLLPII